MKPSPVGIVWYRPEDYARLRSMFADPQQIPETLKEWRKKANHLLGEMIMQGFHMVKIYLDPETFPAWCQAKGVAMDGKARAEYAREAASRTRLPKP